jgi:hypothetical protein
MNCMSKVELEMCQCLPKCRFVLALPVHHVRVLLNEEVERHLDSYGECLQQKTREVLKVFRQFSDVFAESWQRLAGRELNFQ